MTKRFALTVQQANRLSLVQSDSTPVEVDPFDISADIVGAAASFVYRPGGTPADGVYVDTPTLSAALATLDPAAFKTVSVDDSLAAAHITSAGMPVGGWPGFENVEFTSGGPDGSGGALANLIFDQGAKLAGVTHLNGDTIGFTFNSTATVLPTTTTNLSVQFRGVTTSNGAGGVGLADIGAGKAVSYRAYSSAVTGQLFTGSATSTYALLFFSGSSFPTNGVNGTAGGTVLLILDGSSQAGVSASQTPAASTNVLDPLTVFVFRPGATGLLDANVFTTEAALKAAWDLSTGPKILQVDDTLAATTLSLPGWNLEGAVLTTFFNSTGQLNLGVGFTFSGSFTIEGELTVSSAVTTSAHVTSAGEFLAIFVTQGSKLLQTTATAFIQDGTSGVSIFGDFAGIGDGTHPVLQTNAGQTSQVNLLNNSFLQPHACKGVGTVNVVYDASSTPSLTTQDTTTVTSSAVSNASRVAYTPATAGNWNPAPSFDNAALDQLAASNTTQATGNTGTGTGSLSVTTGNITKAKNGKMRVRASALISTSAAATLTIALTRGATPIGTNKTLVAGAALGGLDAGIDFIDTAPDTAAHAYTCTWSVSAGTITCAANSAQASVIEDS